MDQIKVMNIKFFARRLKIYSINTFFFLVFFGSIGLCIYIFKTTQLETKDVIRLVSTSLIPVSIFAAFMSYKENLNQMRKVKANDEIDRILEIIQENRVVLNTHIDFTNRTKSEAPLDPQKEIHEWICEKENGNFVMEADGQCKMTKEGKEIRTALVNIANAYERLGIGVFHLTIDENIAYDSMGHLVHKNYNIFKKYIKHQRSDHGYEDAWVSFEWLYLRWEKRRKS